MNKQEAIEWISTFDHTVDFDVSVRRLSPVGCGAADCSARREADKEQADAEEAKPRSAALIPAVQAEDIIIDTVRQWRREAAESDRNAEYFASAGMGDEAYNMAKQNAAVARRFANSLEGRLSESRKAKAANTLEHDQPETDPTR